MDSTPITSNAWHPGDNERFVLEEVHVPPFLLNRIVDLAVTDLAGRAREGRSLAEVDVQSQLSLGGIEVGPGHLPRWDQAKCGREEWVGVHANTLGRQIDRQLPTDLGTEPKLSKA